MTSDNKDILLRLLQQHKDLGISNQIDYDKFYLYSLITHSTAIEGSTVTEVEAQLLFDEGITAKGKPMVEQLMNLDLKKRIRIWSGMDKASRKHHSGFSNHWLPLKLWQEQGLNIILWVVILTLQKEICAN